jgi:hypothetical protein
MRSNGVVTFKLPQPAKFDRHQDFIDIRIHFTIQIFSILCYLWVFSAIEELGNKLYCFQIFYKIML